MAKDKKWTSRETLMAFVLYWALPTKDIRATNSDVSTLANVIGRSPGAVKAKLGNISSHDEQRVSEGKVGLPHSASAETEIWDRYKAEGDFLITEGINLLDQAVKSQGVTSASPSFVAISLPEGTERLTTVLVRVNQQYFRNTLLENYEHRCCVTGLKVDQLLVASHIKPWSDADPASERLAADNGLLLNAFHDKAFDKGLMTIDYDCRIRISSKVKKDDVTRRWLFDYEGESIKMPRRCRPRREFIEYYNDVVFQG